MRLILTAAAAVLMLLAPATAHDDGQWSDQPPAVRQWFRSLMQPDNAMSCCGEADVFEVEGDHYVAIITNGAGDPLHGKPPIPNGTRIPVPNHKMKWDAGNPTGHGVLFLSVSERSVYCYIAPGGV